MLNLYSLFGISILIHLINATGRILIFAQNGQIPNFSPFAVELQSTASIHDLAQTIISLDLTITGLSPLLQNLTTQHLQFTFADKSIIDEKLLLSDIGILPESLITFSLKPDYHPLFVSLEIKRFNVSISNIHLGHFNYRVKILHFK